MRFSIGTILRGSDEAPPRLRVGLSIFYIVGYQQIFQRSLNTPRAVTMTSFSMEAVSY